MRRETGSRKLIPRLQTHDNRRRRPMRGQHGMRHTSEWYAWKGAKQRCMNPSNRAYGHYGGRGITVCDRWVWGDGKRSGFECFIADMGRKPSPDHSLDRTDNDGPYAPWNCRWATKAEQCWNRRVVRLDPDKVRDIRRSNLTDQELAKRYGVVPGAIWNVRHGLTWRGVPANG